MMSFLSGQSRSNLRLQHPDNFVRLSVRHEPAQIIVVSGNL